MDLELQYKDSIDSIVEIIKENPNYTIGFGRYISSIPKEDVKGLISITDQADDMSYYKTIANIDFPNELIAKEIYEIVMQKIKK